MGTEQYQIEVLEKLTEVSDKVSDTFTALMVLCVIVAAFMMYVIVHNMLNRR